MNLLDKQDYRITRFDKFAAPFAPYWVEMIGTMLLVFIIGCNSAPGSPTAGGPLAPLSIGFGLVVLVFFGGHISGAHYNPAVTLGILITGRSKISLKKSIFYVIVQVLGAFLGALLVYAVLDDGRFGPTIGDNALVYGLIAELIGTFMLVSVVLNVATTDSLSENSFYGLAIGLTVASMGIAVGGLSGGAFNPAVGTGPTLVKFIFGGTFYTNMWIYWVGPLLGAVFAAAFFRVTNISEYMAKKAENATLLSEAEYSTNIGLMTENS